MPTKIKTTKRIKKKPVGRKLFDGKKESMIVGKLEKVFSLGGNVKEALFYADISKDMYYEFLKRKPEFSDRFSDLRVKPILLARMTVVKALSNSNNYKFAFRFLQVRKRDEFGTNPTPYKFEETKKLSDERKAKIMERLEKWKKK